MASPAPAGPFGLPEYKVSEADRSAMLEDEAAKIFQEGQDDNQRSDDYVLNSVFLATVLLFIGIEQRFDWMPLRIVVVAFALAMLVFALYHLTIYPVY